jgi:acetyl-CoA carboxylase carboxyl transferase subunit beta
MSWLTKLIPPKIKRERCAQRAASDSRRPVEQVPVLRGGALPTDLENNLQVCPKCGHHNRLNARQRLDVLLDAEGRFEIGAEVTPVDSAEVQGFQASIRIA